MATPSAKHNSRQPETPAQLQIVDPRWLFKVLGLTIAAAVLLVYLTLCLLFYQGGWQLMLHPSAKIDATPASSFQPIRFDAAETGTPRLTGWWIPADSPSAVTVLFLHDGTGSLSSSVGELGLLHSAGVNLFAIDYRGFGQSDSQHPTEARMAEDAAAALDYLTNTRHLSAARIVPCGVGLGSVLAARLAAEHHDLPGVILDNPDPAAVTRATTGGVSALLPMHLLERERFDIAAAMAGLHTPKLLLTDSSDAARLNADQALFRSAPDPKIAVTFSGNRNDSASAYTQAITRFLDEYVH